VTTADHFAAGMEQTRSLRVDGDNNVGRAVVMSFCRPSSSRRPLRLLACAIALVSLLGFSSLSAAQQPAFTFETVQQQASQLAGAAYKAPAEALPKGAENLDYDQYRQIRFKRDRTLWRGEGLGFEMQVLPTGWLYKVPVEINIVDEGQARPLEPDNGFFDLGAAAGKLAPDARFGFSGFRLLAPMNRPDLFDEVIVFQGASYFRALSRGQSYGLSARGLALNIGEPSGEEFPFFRRFWIEKPKPGAVTVIIYALLDSPSVAGAYKITVTPGAPTRTDVELTLYPRKELGNVGIAPLTSMFLFNTINRTRVNDFRNAVHDSDGLSIHNGFGEQIWRPLNNPKRLQTSHFLDQSPRGYGLIQRSRTLNHFQDLEAAYERRPSAWVEPRQSWGPGMVELFELPTEEEIHDNIVAFWHPRDPLGPGKAHGFSYGLAWSDDSPSTAGARVLASRAGLANGPQRKNGTIQFAVDFSGLGAVGDALPAAKVEASAGGVSAPTVERNAATGGYRVAFTLDPKGAPFSELRLVMTMGSASTNAKPVSETWLYRWTSE
jgi:glucans biosynthesis protein